MKYQKIIEVLKRKKYDVQFFEKKDEAVKFLENRINNKTVGFGDSKTLEALDLFHILSKNNTVYDPAQFQDDHFLEVAKKALTTDIFITSVNAASETGELVNIDGSGNRLAGSLFGHDEVIFVFGTNKIEETLDKAIHRARNVAAPQNAKKYGLKTPCAVSDKGCFDCASPDRICSAMTIYMQKMNDMDMTIIIINEELGY